MPNIKCNIIVLRWSDISYQNKNSLYFFSNNTKKNQDRFSPDFQKNLAILFFQQQL